MKNYLKLLICTIFISSFSISLAYATTPTPAPDGTVEVETVDTETIVTEDANDILVDITSKPQASPDADILPEATTEPEPIPSTLPLIDNDGIIPTSTTLDFHVVIAPRRIVVDSNIELEVYDKNNTLVGKSERWVGGITKAVDFHFDVPTYTLGDAFTVKLVNGAERIAYYDTKVKPGGSFTVTTGFSLDEENKPVAENKFNLDAIPLWEKEVLIFVNDKKASISPRARIINDKTLIPIRAVAEAMHLTVFYDKDYDSVVCSIGDDEVIFNLGSKYATMFGEGKNLEVAPCYINGNAYIHIRSLTDAFDAPLDVIDKGDKLEITIGESPMIKEFLSRTPVNQWNISSDTDYMVWVDKSEYTVRLFEGSKNNWKLIHTAPCGIGAPSTPTITGSFRYIERTRWNYNTYYVGPVLRFHNGYALHSTLLNYDGTEYDGRVGIKLSHGCIRMHPEDINLIANTIPLYTRIYITE